jgi:transcriptional regulator with XRE-family HTH domain
MNKREELLRNREYVVSQMQLSLLNLVGNYKDQNKVKDYQLAKKLGVSKGYVSQLLNATSDHKLSKIAELALACNTMPLLYFVDLDTFIKEDAEDKYFELFPTVRKQGITYEIKNSTPGKSQERFIANPIAFSEGKYTVNLAK